MTFEEAVQIAHQEAAETGKTQAVVRLQGSWHGEAVYIPIEARYASGLRGKVVKTIDPKEEQ